MDHKVVKVIYFKKDESDRDASLQLYETHYKHSSQTPDFNLTPLDLQSSF